MLLGEKPRFMTLCYASGLPTNVKFQAKLKMDGQITLAWRMQLTLQVTS